MVREKLSDKDEVIEKKTAADELTLNEMTPFMKERFTRSGTDEVRAMFYHKAIEKWMHWWENLSDD